MKQHSSLASRQSGVMLIEALIAILIFSIGVLGIIGLQGSAVKASTDSKYRSEAALLANELIGRMWSGDRTQATLQAAYASGTNGAAYQQWAWMGATATPGTTSAPASGTVLGTLPGAIANPPTVVIVPNAGAVPPTSQVTINIFWQVPGEAAVHNYMVMAEVGG